MILASRRRHFMRFPLICFLLWAGPALAQTTTWNPSDSNARITLSNNKLTATAAADNTVKVVRATKGKWFSGKWCYQFRVNAPITGFSVGLATADYPLQPQATPPYLGNSNLNEGHLSAGIQPGGGVYFVNHLYGTADPPLNGKTGEVCVDMDATPPALWITPAVTGTGGPGGGPKWNGDAAANPVGDVNGALIYFPFSGRAAKALGSCCYFPAFQGQNGDSITANFSSFTPPPGYQTWDTAGGEVPSDPNPWTPLHINVANAPAWQPGQAHGLKDRIVAGPAWNGGAYTNGQHLCLWAVKTRGTSGTDPTVFNARCSAGTPASYGSGLDGTIPSGWASATTVIDGSVTWVLLSKVDYVTLTGAFSDDDVNWTPSTNYGGKQFVIDPNGGVAGRAYRNTNLPNTTDPQCTSAAVGPFNPASDGTSGVGFGPCGWQNMGDITYSSKAHIFKHWGMVPGGRSPGGNSRNYYDVVYNIWYGGAQRTRYQPGQNGEADPILIIDHGSDDSEGYAFGYHGGVGTTAAGICAQDSYCMTADGSGARTYFRAAPGDSFGNNLRPGIDPLRYDESKGVSLYSNSPYADNNWVQNGAPMNSLESATVYDGLQMKSENGWATTHDTNFAVVKNSILDGVGAADTTVQGLVLNSLIVVRGKVGLYGKYRIGMSQSTVICDPTVQDSMAITTFNGGGAGPWPWGNGSGGPPFYNNVILGCKHDLVTGSRDFGTDIPSPFMWTSPMTSGGNATDIANPAAPAMVAPWALYPSQNIYPYGALTFGGYGNTCGPSNTSPCTGLNPADVVVNPTIGPRLDATLKPNSPVKGAGVNFSFPMVPGDNSGRWWGWLSELSGPQVPRLTPPSVNIAGTPRPQ